MCFLGVTNCTLEFVQILKSIFPFFRGANKLYFTVYPVNRYTGYFLVKTGLIQSFQIDPKAKNQAEFG